MTRHGEMNMNKNDNQKKTELINNHSERILINTILKLYIIDLEECTLEELEDVVSFFHHKAQVLKKVMGKKKGVNIVMAGGVRGGKDLELLKEAGVAKVLVASALHDGGLSRAMLETLTKKALPFDAKGSAINLSRLS